MNARSAPARLRVARVVRAHGVRGEVRVEPLGGDASRFHPGLRLHVDHLGGESGRVPPTVVRSARPLGDHVLLAFEGIEDPERAAALKDAYLSVDAEHARSLSEGEWFVWQLVGMEVCDTRGTPLGTVDDVEPGVASDILVVRRGEHVRRFPMVGAFVTDVDMDSGRVTLEPWDEEA